MFQNSIFPQAAALSGDASDTDRDMQTSLMQDAADFHQVLTQLVRIYMFRDRDRSGSHDVGVTGAHALDILVRQGGIGLNQLATELFVDKSTASRIVADLEEKGYISRTINREDRRTVRLEVTSAGRELHQRIQKDNLREAAELLRPFAAETRQAMMARLRQIAGTFAIHAGVSDASVSLLSGSGESLPFGADLRIAGRPDLEEALALLDSLDLPTDGVREDFLGSFVVARKPENEELIGLAGIESYGTVGLLRSVAVHPSCQRAGLGSVLTLAAVRLAKIRGLRELYLLTAIGEDVLFQHGWEKIDHEELPSMLQASEQQREAYPSTAMRLRIT